MNHLQTQLIKCWENSEIRRSEIRRLEELKNIVFGKTKLPNTSLITLNIPNLMKKIINRLPSALKDGGEEIYRYIYLLGYHTCPDPNTFEKDFQKMMTKDLSWKSSLKACQVIQEITNYDRTTTIRHMMVTELANFQRFECNKEDGFYFWISIEHFIKLLILELRSQLESKIK